jgi:Alternate to MurJ
MQLIWIIGVFASLYAGYLNPELRVTSSTLSSVVNGVANIMMFVFIGSGCSVHRVHGQEHVVHAKANPSCKRTCLRHAAYFTR